ncbi:MAG: HDOD domain-containing protein [Fimbriimonadaceae bacterium]
MLDPLKNRSLVIRKHIRQSLQDLPALPQVVTRILQETQKDDVSAVVLERLIGSDQALAAKTLRVVNSAYYGMESQVSSLSQAVVILGMQQLRNLVLSLSAISLMKARTPRQQELQRKYWMHAMATASSAQLIGKKKKFETKEMESVFVGGLLHDIGRLFLYTNFTETYIEVEKIARQTGVSPEEKEREKLGVSHCEVGTELAKMWRFPEELAEFIADHHGPFSETSRPAVLAIHCGDVVAQMVTDPDGIAHHFDPYASAWLGYGDEELQWLARETEQKLTAYESLFGMMAA